jgi:hypothetical protein
VFEGLSARVITNKAPALLRQGFERFHQIDRCLWLVAKDI